MFGIIFPLQSGADLSHQAFTNISAFLEILVTIGVVLGIPLALVAILTQRAVSGQFNFAIKAAAFKAKKWNQSPVLVECLAQRDRRTGKAIPKELIGGGRGCYLIFSGGDNFAIAIPITCAVNGINFVDLSEGSGRAVLVLAVIAFIDFIYQRHTHTKSLKMSKQEQKDEHKQTEGSPEVKANSPDADGKICQCSPSDSRPR